MTTAASPSTTDLQVELIVGMEIHVELATRSKMFSPTPNVAHPDYYDAPPNSLCDPIVLGMPGVLPVINRQAVEMAVLVGLALNCKIARFTKWDRKSYYYPDLPKNYQISQYDLPLCYDGAVEIPALDHDGQPLGFSRTIRIRRAHLEEDAGKLLHEAPGGLPIDYSIVDLNRAGTPLLEIVTQPDFRSAHEVVAFAQLLRDICRFLGVSQGIMQRGHMRFEPNINLHITRNGQTYKTPIVEVKNLNSFRALQGAVAYEYHRQLQEWLETGRVMTPGSKSTRGWDDVRGVTVLQREKEEAHDYRYFPDPDLVPLVIDDAWLDQIRSRLVELPPARLARYTQQLGLGEKEARQILEEPRVALFFDQLLAAGLEPRRAAALLLNNLARRANDRGVLPCDLGIQPHQLKAIDDMLAAGRISSNAADQLIGLCCDSPQADPAQLAQEYNLIQISDDSTLEAWCDRAIAENPKSVQAVQSGKLAALGALVGAVMKLSAGQANPRRVQEILRKKLLGQ